MVALKICGVTRPEDLRACVDLGVDAVGFNLWPGSKRYISLQGAEQLHAAVPAAVSCGLLRVGVFVDLELPPIIRAVTSLGLDLIQPHGDGPVEPVAEFAGDYGIGWIWVIRGTPALASLRVPEPRPAWILLDAAVPGYGGAGRQTDWVWAAEAVEALAPTPVWLAGGVTPANVAAAISEVRPAGIDVASGAEQPGAARGEKQREAIAALIGACRSGAGP